METTDIDQIFREISELRDQYQAEVGSKRKAWPRSIVERVFQLSRLGIRYGVIAERSGVPVNTIYSWENRPLKRSSGTFVSLPVVRATPVAQNPLRRAVRPRHPTVTVVTRDGVRIEGLPVKGLVKLLRGLASP